MTTPSPIPEADPAATLGPTLATLGLSETDATFAANDTGPGRGPAPEAPRLPPGTVLNGRYTVEAVVGEGGMGVVYRVADALHPERDVALKTIRGSAIRPARLSLFKAEFRTMTRLRHPNLAEVYDFEPIQGSKDHLFTMAYVKGRDLWAATEDAPYPEIVAWLVEVCRALSYVHSRQIIHYDLKPQNVMVTPDGRVKVFDFGVAAGRPAAGDCAVRGTHYYMAPELSDIDAQRDHRADLYSLGIMSFQLLCRRLPFAGRSAVDWLQQHHFERVVFSEAERARLPAWLRDVVLKLCAKQPSDRFRTANAVIDAINRTGGLAYELETKETRESYLLSSRFVGREAELSSLWRLVRDRTSVSGEGEREAPGRFVAGPSGVGKSRLLREVRHQAQLSRLPFVGGSCHEGGANEYGPIAEVVGHLTTMGRALGATDLLETHGPVLAQIRPQLEAELGVTRASNPSDPKAEQQRLQHAVCALALGLARQTPYVLCLDDLQWAALGTVEVLELLLRTVAAEEETSGPVPLAILGGLRDDEVQSRHVGRLLSKGAHFTVQTLVPLDASCVAELLGSMLGIDALPEALVGRVGSEAGGNPFFLQELMRVLVENGSVYVDQDRWAATAEVGELDLPSGMAEAVLRRLSHSSEGERELLTELAIWGRPTPVKHLAESAGIGSEESCGALAALARRQLVRSLDNGRYHVFHDKIRETLYAEVPEDERRARHDRVVAVLETAGTELAALAHHSWEAARDGRAMEYNLRAGEAAQREHAHEQAALFLERGIGLLMEREPHSERVRELRERMADSLRLSGELERASAVYRELLEGSHDRLDRARMHRKLGSIALLREDPGATLARFRSAIRTLGDSWPRGALATRFLAAIAYLALRLRSGRPFEPATSGKERARLEELCRVYNDFGFAAHRLPPELLFLLMYRQMCAAERLGPASPGWLALGYASIAFFYCFIRRLSDSERYSEQALAFASQIDDPYLRGVAKTTLARLCGMTRDVEMALELNREATEELHPFGSDINVLMAYYRQSLLFWLHGDVAECLRSAEVALARCRAAAVGDVWARLAVSSVGVGKMMCGQLEDGEAMLLRVAAESEVASDRGYAHFNIGFAKLLHERFDGAEAAFLMAEAMLDEMGSPNAIELFAQALPAYAIAKISAHRAQKRPRACPLDLGALRARIRRGERIFRLPAGRPLVLHATALVEAEAGNDARAAEAFAESRRIATEFGHRVMLGMVLRSEARWRIDRGEPEGRALLQEALAVFEACGVDLVVERIRAELGGTDTGLTP